MWLLLVTTVAMVVLVDAGYLYNPPNVVFNLPSNNYMRYGYNNEEVKNNAHFRNDHIQSNNAHVTQLTANNNHWQIYGNTGYAGIQRNFLNPQSSRSYFTGHSSNGYGGYTEPFTPLNQFNNNQINLQHAVSSISSRANVGSIQTSSLPSGSAMNLPVGTGYSNSYSSPIYDLNVNSGSTQPLAASGNSNYNYGYQRTYAPSGSTALQNNYGQSFAPIGGNNLKSSFSNAAATNSYSGGYTALKSQTSTSLNNQAKQTSVPLNNGYSQTATSFVGYNVNTGLQNFTPITTFNSNNEYAQTVSSSVSSQYNSGSVTQSLIPPVAVNLNNGYDQSLKSGNNGFSQSQSTGPTHIDLSSDLIQSSSTSSTTSGNSPLKNVLVQISPTHQVKSSSSNPGVTPTIHKHIYFHVPPPEIEEPSKPISPSPSAKKNYKILFIKMPSQDSKSNIIRLQQQMQNAHIEDRTIIYVLVKKPENPKPVILPQPKPSQHQVFFVKYNDSPFDIAARVSEEIDKTGSIKSIVPLEPGLVNGQHR